MSDNDKPTKTKITRPAEGTAKDATTEAEVAANTASAPDAPDTSEKNAAAVSRSTPSAGSFFKPPFAAEGTSVTDSQGLLVCRSGAEHLDTDQRRAVAAWVAGALSAAL